MEMVRAEIERDGLTRDELQTLKNARDDLNEVINESESE